MCCGWPPASAQSTTAGPVAEETERPKEDGTVEREGTRQVRIPSAGYCGMRDARDSPPHRTQVQAHSHIYFHTQPLEFKVTLLARTHTITHAHTHTVTHCCGTHLAVKPIEDASVTRDCVSKVLQPECTLEARRKEAAKGRDDAREAAHDKGVQLRNRV